MNTKIKSLLLLLAGALLFNFLFWMQTPGLNVLLFVVFILLSVFISFPSSLKSKLNLIVASFFVLGGILMMIQNSPFVFPLMFFSWFLFIGSTQSSRWRSLWYILPQGFSSYLLLPVFFNKNINKISAPNRRLPAKIWRIFKLLLIPLGLFMIFLIIYSSGNQVFNNLVGDFFFKLGRLFSNLDIEPQRIIFFVAGFIICSGILLKSSSSFFNIKDLSASDFISRKRKRIRQTNPELNNEFIFGIKRSMMGLKKEMIIGIISLFSLNILIAVLIGLDIQYVWFDQSGNISMADQLHEGTGQLIGSILLAMMLLFVLFRGNLNFYKQNSWLKRLSYTWLLLNFLLVVSVFIRDYYYISTYGLTYKRIGVILYLLLTAFGLITLVIKIAKSKSLYFIFRVNAWFGFSLLLLMSSINIDRHIAYYNLNWCSINKIDINYILNLSPNAFPEIEKKKYLLSDQNQKRFEKKKQRFLIRFNEKDWQSWTLADQLVYQSLSVH